MIHRSRGRPSNRGKAPEVKEAVLSVYQERYWDFGPTLAAEKAEREGYQVGRETLRRWLKDAGLWERHRKRSKHRTRRERKVHFGELVQMDGSHHQWFSGHKGKGCLMDMVDDATGITLSLMRREETTKAAMEVLWAWIEKYGVPRSLYVDRKTVYITGREPTLEEQLAGEEPFTQFGRACRKLGIEIVTASSPQAKGRVERKHGVFQDHLVKELRLEGIQDIPAANAFLTGYLGTLNGKFAVEPGSQADFHQPVPEGLDLRNVFCLEETRVISNDWVIRYKNRFFQLVSQSKLPPAKN
ncbi:ISNCY family transposase, partial [Dehalococcoidia bacterium]|nr:ISNCY family transposase [Dehalococcoidia bacterium]